MLPLKPSVPPSSLNVSPGELSLPSPRDFYLPDTLLSQGLAPSSLPPPTPTASIQSRAAERQRGQLII